MIRYALLCEHDHDFEGWFAASADFDDQQARGLIACPVCATTAVGKAIIAPALTGTKRRGDSQAPAQGHAMMMEAMGRIRRHVEDTFDDVGDAFASEARAIHEGRSEERGIYGQATSAEVRDLVEDGVPIAPLPPNASGKRASSPGSSPVPKRTGEVAEADGGAYRPHAPPFARISDPPPRSLPFRGGACYGSSLPARSLDDPYARRRGVALSLCVKSAARAVAHLPSRTSRPGGFPRPHSGADRDQMTVSAGPARSRRPGASRP